MADDLQAAPRPETAPPAAPEATNPDALKLGFRWFLAGFGLLGLCVGYHAGGSASPVVGVLLPLLFGLVGGAGGLYLASADLAAAATAVRLRLLGIALTIFVALLLLGSVYGMMLRTGLGLASFVPHTPAAETAELNLDERDSREALQLVLTRSRLKALGASDAEQAAILRRLTGEQSGAPRSFADALLRLAVQMDRVTAAIPRVPSDKQPLALVKLAPYLEAYAKDYRQLAANIRGGKQVSAPEVAYYVKTVRDYLDDRLKDPGPEVLQYLADRDELRKALLELRWALLEEAGRLEASPALDRPQVVLEIDRFLATAGGAKADVQLVDKPSLGPHYAK